MDKPRSLAVIVGSLRKDSINGGRTGMATDAVGYPRVLNALTLVQEVMAERGVAQELSAG